MTIHLEPFGEWDIDRLIAWTPTEAFLLQWAGPRFRFPLDRQQLLQHMAGAEGSCPDRLMYKAVDDSSCEVVGHGELSAIDRHHRSASLARILVGPEERRGQGNGEAIVRGLLSVAFDELRLHRVQLHVYDFNTAAIRCYEKIGFRREGTLREARRCGDEYWSMHVMGLLEQEWRGLNSR